MIDSASVTSVVFFGDARDSWIGRWRPIVRRFILPFASPRSVFQSRNGLTTAMNARLQRARIIGGSARGVSIERYDYEREANEAFRFGGGRGVRKKFVKLCGRRVWEATSERVSEHVRENCICALFAWCVWLVRVSLLKSSVSVIIKREATNYVSSLGS